MFLTGLIGQRLVRDAAVPGRAGALHAVAAQRARFGIVDAARRASGSYSSGLPVFGSIPLVQFRSLTYLLALDELAVGAIERVEEAVAPEVADDLAVLAVDRGVVQHVDADLVEVPRIVRRVLEVPGELAGLDVERDRRVGVEVVARPRLRIVDRKRIAGAPRCELGRGVVGAGLPDAAAAGLPGVVILSFQVSLPGSPGFGTTYQRHSSLPVLTSSAASQPRVPRVARAVRRRAPCLRRRSAR